MHLSSLERYEIQAEAFRRMTGHLAPGKDAAAGTYDEAANRTEIYARWAELHGECVYAVLDAVDYVLRTGDDLLVGPIFEDGMLPCPFCGGRPTLWPDRNGEVSPYCEDCGAGFFGGGLADEFSKDGEPFHSDERSAVEYWNRRVAPNTRIKPRCEAASA